MDLDRHDRQLLALVQQDATRTADALAEHVPLSPSAIQRRLKRLREGGVILREVSVVDPAAVGGLTLFLASLHVAQERPGHVDALRRWLEAEPAVQEAFYVTGDADFELVVAASDPAAYDAFMSRLLAAHPHVQRFTTRVVMGVLKRGLAVPV